MQMGLNDFSASDVVNKLDAQELEQIFKFFGDEREAKKISLKIVEKRQSKKLNNKDLVEIADALGDKLYILCGTILAHGLQDKIVEVFEEIQRSNMSKLSTDGSPVIREDGKILKGPNYFKPNIKDILEK